jgi:hypothetical protein
MLTGYSIRQSIYCSHPSLPPGSLKILEEGHVFIEYDLKEGETTDQLQYLKECEITDHFEHGFSFSQLPNFGENMIVTRYSRYRGRDKQTFELLRKGAYENVSFGKFRSEQRRTFYHDEE